MIEFFAEEVSLPEMDFDKIKSWVQGAIESKNFHLAEISFIFCSDNYLLGLNKMYLKHDYFTDIITFEYNEGNYISGDLFISIERVSENADKLNISFLDELLRVCIHGILHLLGYEDHSLVQKRKMRLEEDKFIKIFLNAKEI